MLWPRKFFENLGQKFAENCTESHAPQHADARHSAWGPRRVVNRPQHVKHSGFRRDLDRKILRPRKLFEKLIWVRNPPRMAPNLTRRVKWWAINKPRTCGQQSAGEIQRISARSLAISIAKFCGREIFFANFGQIFAENRTESHAPRRSMPTLGTVLGDLGGS